jgi:hypothetical protein
MREIENVGLACPWPKWPCLFTAHIVMNHRGILTNNKDETKPMVGYNLIHLIEIGLVYLKI